MDVGISDLDTFALEDRRRDTFEAREGDHQERLDLSTPLNAVSRINRIPVELLAEILKHVQNDDDIVRWLDVLLVCKHWYAVAAGAPTLWQRLMVDKSTNLLCTGLARSGCMELELYHAGYYPFRLLSQFVRLVEPHCNRLRGLRVGRIPLLRVPDLVNLMANTMPALRHFQASLYQGSDTRGQTPLDLSPDRFPKLQELDVFNIYICDDIDIIPQLKVLKFDYDTDPEPSLANFINTLRCLRDVEELALGSGITLWDDFEGLPTGHPAVVGATSRVTLQKLRTFDLDDMSGLLIKLILSEFVIPRTATVSISRSLTADDEDREAGTSLRAVIPNDRSCLPILSDVVKAHIVSTLELHELWCSPVEGMRHAEDSNSNPSLELWQAIPDMGPGFGDFPDWQDLFDILRDSPLQTLFVETGINEIAKVDWRGILAVYPALRRLDITTDSGEFFIPEFEPGVFDAIFSALNPEFGSSTDDQRGSAAFGPEVDCPGSLATAPVLCPQLRHLALHVQGPLASHAVVLKSIVACLENRRRRGMAAELDHWVLEELELELVGRDDEEAWPSVRAAYEDSLKTLVKSVTYNYRSQDEDFKLKRGDY